MTAPARLGHRDVRDGSAVRAGAYPFEVGAEVVTGWHSHDLHQLEYAFEGMAQVETAAHLAEVTQKDVCAAVGTSERSLRRAFVSETGMSWRQYLLESRLLQAMALLAQPGRSVLAVATAVGFQSMSGFTRAFRRYSGETPRGYRRRVMPPRPAG